MELTRKCKICGKNIFIERDRSTFFYDKIGFYHKDCFVEKKKNQKMYKTLGVVVGLVFCIILF